MLTPAVGYYSDPVVTLDFSSLYPSCMMEMNICASTRLMRSEALALGIQFHVPPAPSCDGVWIDAEGKHVSTCVEHSDAKIEFVIGRGPAKRTRVARYSNELNQTLTFADTGEVATLQDVGYALEFADGTAWRRRDSDVLVLVHESVREGIVPKMERTLKMDRKAAKKKGAAADEAGDSGGVAFFDNLQNSIKVIMNALYGALGVSKGGIFPNSSPLASAITARGRMQIVTVKQNVESRFLLSADGSVMKEVPDSHAADANDGAPLRVLYGDTDSVMIHFPGCTLAQAAAHGAALSAWFGANILKAPHVLEFEKVLWPVAFFRKKMYAATKYEQYGEDAKGKFFAKGLSAVRRDNAKLVKTIVSAAMDDMFKYKKPAADVVANAARSIAAVRNSAAVVYAGPEREFEGRLPFESFVQSAGISKPLEEYASDNAATAVAKQLLQLDAQSGVGKNSRVTFVVIAAGKDAKRSEQALLPSIAQSRQAPLDAGFYVEALMKKLAPLLSVYFRDAEVASSTRMVTLDGAGTLARGKQKASAASRLLGEATAERALMDALRTHPVLHVATGFQKVKATVKRPMVTETKTEDARKKQREDNQAKRKFLNFFQKK